MLQLTYVGVRTETPAFVRYRGNVCTSRLPSEGFDLQSAVSSVRHSKGTGISWHLCMQQRSITAGLGLLKLHRAAYICCLQATSVSIMYVIVTTELGAPSYVS